MMIPDLKIDGTFARRAELQAALRQMVVQGTRWQHLAIANDYSNGYYAGYIDAIRQMAGIIEVDAGINDQTDSIIEVS